MALLPMDVDAATVLQMTLAYFRDRLNRPIVTEDLDYLEKAMATYSALKCNEHIKAQETEKSA